MFSWEIKEYIEERSYYLTPEEVSYITSIKEHPQINHVILKKDHYEMWDKQGNHFIFYYKPISKVKILVKTSLNRS